MSMFQPSNNLVLTTITAIPFANRYCFCRWNHIAPASLQWQSSWLGLKAHRPCEPAVAEFMVRTEGTSPLPACSGRVHG
jgi:hypothetical protein